jgi:hypothetical protein
MYSYPTIGRRSSHLAENEPRVHRRGIANIYAHWLHRPG